MTDAPNVPETDLQEVTTRNTVARDVIAGFAAASTSYVWQYVADALADVPGLAAEVARLRDEARTVRLDRANLAAAALAALAAHHDGEPDPLLYLRDELAAQGHVLRGRS
ncbi:hypothetical protein DPM19_00730 [Actinomadura craniellae]|uniref:Uncharacterized protein n=1 Tax=Actinomadura craniellae TaxID=2231787 RepID=A0A365HC77_9ACTN|nr:hypothetical protein [Actinomadura craniellae]RAY16730.1 hypothetical protein DPM19_00730 [Actinomadura craniellae]